MSCNCKAGFEWLGEWICRRCGTPSLDGNTPAPAPDRLRIRCQIESSYLVEGGGMILKLRISRSAIEDGTNRLLRKAEENACLVTLELEQRT
jgi:hypothetical protein